jgi:hypothetical protein
MSTGNLHGAVNGSAERNGTAARGTVSPRGVRRPAPPKRIEREAKPSSQLAGFVKPELQARDASMWPIHPVMWLQPELLLALPAASGLHIERKHPVPSPDFLRDAIASAGTTPVDRQASLEKAAHPVLPKISQQFPQAGLTPLGWDPRVATQGTGKEDQE